MLMSQGLLPKLNIFRQYARGVEAEVGAMPRGTSRDEGAISLRLCGSPLRN
jgi:hypothetical protein